MIDRRTFLMGSVGLLAAPLAAKAQPTGKTYRIALVFASIPIAELTESAHPLLRAFFAELRRLGYVEGQNLTVVRRSALGRPERFPEIAAEVVRLNPDVVVVPINRLARAFKAETNTIPIVGGGLSFPQEYGLIASLARPGGNLTGVTDDAGPEVFTKGLELLTEVAPGLSRVAYLGSTSSWNGPVGNLLRNAAPRVGVALVPTLMDGAFQEAQYSEAFRNMTQNGARGMLIGPEGEHWANRRLIAEVAIRHRLPTMAAWREFVEVGGLTAYGVSNANNWRRAAHYVDRILKGAKPADLPVEQPTKFEFIVNLNTAKALGLTIPPRSTARRRSSMLPRASCCWVCRAAVRARRRSRRESGVPLLRLDFGALYNKFIGETERNLREALVTADVMAPCVLWIDEIEKGLATGDGDSGMSRRLLGGFLTWMAERKSRCSSSRPPTTSTRCRRS